MTNARTSEGPRLFSEFGLRSVVARNRIVVSPMCQYSATDGLPNDWHVIHLGSRAVGGAGIVFTEAAAVEPRGRITPGDVGLWNDQQEAAFGRIAQFIRERDAIAGIQLAHAGRKASHSRPWEGRTRLDGHAGWEVVSPSSIPWMPDEPDPIELDRSAIDGLVSCFRNSAERALRAGFQILELHAAHGYLLHSFLSPVSNRRTDEYGGDLANRARLLLEVVHEVRGVWPDHLPLAVRLSVTDWLDDEGLTVSDTVRVAGWLKEVGVDLIDCSSGGSSPKQRVTPGPGYQVPLARAVRDGAGIPTAAVGLISTARQAEAILESGAADLIVLGRIVLWDPYWPVHAAAELGVPPRLPVQYERSAVYLESGIADEMRQRVALQ